MHTIHNINHVGISMKYNMNCILYYNIYLIYKNCNFRPNYNIIIPTDLTIIIYRYRYLVYVYLLLSTKNYEINIYYFSFSQYNKVLKT